MSKIKELINELDTEVNLAYDEYVRLNKELDSHRGKELNDTNLVEVNRLLKEIQDVFAELYPAYHFIGIRTQSTNNIVEGYFNFIETLKKAGADAEGSSPVIKAH